MQGIGKNTSDVLRYNIARHVTPTRPHPMPITQARLLTLLEEYESHCTQVTDNLNAIESAIKAGLAGEALLAATGIFFRNVRLLAITQRVLERERLNTRWKRNERLRGKAERKRRAAGIDAAPERADIGSNVAHEDFDEAEYAAFNRGEKE
jgi:hypothetical protein